MKYNIKDLFKDFGINGIATDSRKVKQGDAFFAIKGKERDGNEFLEQAFENGASLVFTERLDLSLDNHKIIAVDDVIAALAEAAELTYPAKPNHLIAVTGTNGKSSVVSYCQQIITLLGKKAASLGTLGVMTSDAVIHEGESAGGYNFAPSRTPQGCGDPAFLDGHVAIAPRHDDLIATLSSTKNNEYTTAGLIEFREILNILASNGYDYVAFEASSHGLDQRRLENIKVQAAAFTNLSHDHLDYHASMKDYFEAKLKLFSNHLASGGICTISQDLIDQLESLQLDTSYLKSLNPVIVGNGTGDINIRSISGSISGQDVTLTYKGITYQFATEIIGSFQATNLLIAAALVESIGFDFGEIVKVLPKLKAVLGRLERITNVAAPFQIFVDYAHTPDALTKSLQELSKLKTNGKLKVIFGCGGDRDRGKRPIMGSVASQFADQIFITDDNPRFEDASQIRRQIIAGVDESLSHKVIEIPGRDQAIYRAIAELENKDILLIAGKGHEDYQIIGDQKFKFSDQEKVNDSYVWNQESLEAVLGVKVPSKILAQKIQFNSKDLKPGDLFIALSGGAGDGHDYVKDALNRGAAAAIVSKKIGEIDPLRLIYVTDTMVALEQLANYKRQRSKAKFVAITGSAGKTTTKDITSKLLRRFGKIFASRGNFNNKLGLMINLASMPDDIYYAVIELGMNHAGEIRELTKQLKPDIALITNIAPAHLQFFGSVEEIADAKSEIFESLTSEGIAIINQDSPYFERMKSNLHRYCTANNVSVNMLTFGENDNSDVRLASYCPESSSAKVALEYVVKSELGDSQKIKLSLEHTPRHYALNIAAGLAVAMALKLDPNVAAASSEFVMLDGRGKIISAIKDGKHYQIISDYYNANPESMKAALEYFGQIPSVKKIAIIGDMLELGENAAGLHESLAPFIVNSGANTVLLVGHLMSGLKHILPATINSRAFSNINELLASIESLIEQDLISGGDLILIKGSNSINLKKIMDYFTSEDGNAL